MGFLSSIKNKLGIGGVSIDFTVPAQGSKTGGTLEGVITLTTKSEQEVLKIEALLEEEWTSGVGDDRGTKTYELGKWISFDNFTIRPGEVKEVPYKIDYQELKSEMDNLSARGGVLGGIGKLAKLANREKSNFSVRINVDVKSAVLDPTEKKAIKLG